MVKILMMVGFMFGMIKFNNMIVFYSSLCFLLSFLILFMYVMNMGDFWIFISMYMGMDSYSYYLILMSLWVIGLMFLSLMGGDCWLMSSMKLFVFIFVLMVLILFFSVMNLMLMYFFFEVSLIPTFMIVVFWGSSYERLSASFYLIMYMMFISFPLLAYVMKIYFYNFTLDMNVLMVLDFNKFDWVMGKWDYLILFLAFFIKLPIYLFHIWLPKAHVEAPVYGSMLLAAVLLKLGGYGLLRFIVVFSKWSMKLSYILVSVGILGAVYVGVYCLVQVDMKMLVAYSSVVHMNFMLCSLYSLTKMGFISSLLVMVSHGLCSSGLFFMVNMFYKRTHSRMIVMNKSSLSMIPSVGIWWFFLCSSNFSFPFSLNFMGEVMLFMVLLSWSISLVVLVGLVGFFSGAYSLYLFSSVFHGQLSVGGVEVRGLISYNGLLVEHVSLLLHYSPLILFMFNLTLFL